MASMDLTFRLGWGARLSLIGASLVLQAICRAPWPSAQRRVAWGERVVAWGMRRVETGMKPEVR